MAQDIDMEQVIAENRGAVLKMHHIVTYLNFSIENGTVSADASQEEINDFFQEVIIAFNQAPAKTIAMIEQISEEIQEDHSSVQIRTDQQDIPHSASPVYEFRACWESLRTAH